LLEKEIAGNVLVLTFWIPNLLTSLLLHTSTFGMG